MLTQNIIPMFLALFKYGKIRACSKKNKDFDNLEEFEEQWSSELEQ